MSYTMFASLATDFDDSADAPLPHQAQFLLKEYADVFAAIPPGLPPDRGIHHTINTGDAPPVSRPMYRMSPKERECADFMVLELIEKGGPSHAPYSSPILFVQKKDGSLRMCVDYRAMNTQTVRDRYPLPKIADSLIAWAKPRIFSSLDLQSGYHQIRVAEQDVPKTAFITHKSLYEYLVMPFGFSNTPAAFQREMNRIFSHMPFVIVYMDDILIYSANEAEHKQHLSSALKALRDNSYSVKLSKCSFFQSEVKFLGHVVTGKGIQPNPDKVKVIQDWPEPTNVKEIRSFLGLANFFRKSIMGFF